MRVRAYFFLSFRLHVCVLFGCRKLLFSLLWRLPRRRSVRGGKEDVARPTSPTAPSAHT